MSAYTLTGPRYYLKLIIEQALVLKGRLGLTRPSLRGVTWLALLIGGLLVLSRAPGPVSSGLPVAPGGIQIQGNQFVSNGQELRLRGVFYVSFEWACTHGGGVTSQPINQAAIQALQSWHINFVRIGV